MQISITRVGLYLNSGKYVEGLLWVAALHNSTTPAAANGCKAALRQEFFDHRSLTGSFHAKQSFKLPEKLDGEGQKTARCGRSQYTELSA